MNPIVYEAFFSPIDPVLYAFLIVFIIALALIGGVVILGEKIFNWLSKRNKAKIDK